MGVETLLNFYINYKPVRKGNPRRKKETKLITGYILRSFGDPALFHSDSLF